MPWIAMFFRRSQKSKGQCAAAGLSTWNRTARLRLELAANLPAFVCRTVHVHVQIARLEALVLRIGQLRARGHAPDVIGCLHERNDDRTVLACGSFVNMRS